MADHVKLYNTPESIHVACIVKRMSLLYVVFERVDNGMMVGDRAALGHEQF